MDIKRVQEILESDENIEVVYNGSSVWLETLHQEDEIVNVKVLEDNRHITVPSVSLRETGRPLK